MAVEVNMGKVRLTEEEMRIISTLEKNNRLVKGQVFLWPGASDWHDLWDENGVIVDCPDEGKKYF